jgi:hypothetical protein
VIYGNVSIWDWSLEKPRKACLHRGDMADFNEQQSEERNEESSHNI